MSDLKDDKEQKKQITLFTEEKRRNVVYGFITAYMGGQIKFKSIHLNEKTLDFLKDLEYIVAISTGAEKATESEIHDNIDKLFRAIFILRMSNTLEGQFLDNPEIETRIVSLEEKVSHLERLMEELQIVVRSFRGDSPENMP